jgi:hypothetical protein
MQKKISVATLLFAAIVLSVTLYAQDGNAGINDANTKVRSYFQSGTNLMYAVGAILGLIGAVKVYQKWNSGDQIQERWQRPGLAPVFSWLL